MNKIGNFIVLVSAFLVNCGPPSATDDTADSADESTLESDCASFCGPAYECSEEYAADWEFESQQECVDYCMLFTTSKVIFHDEPACEHTTRAMWACAGVIETCEDFGWFEDAAFGKTGLLGKPCADELIDFLDNCN